MSLKIIFMGTPEFAVPILKSLKESEHELLCVYSQPPKKRARGQKILSSPIHEYAKKLELSVRCPINFDTDEEYDFIKEIDPDIVIVVAYGKIIPKRFLSLTKFGFINIHASLLPKWRGAAPIQRSIMNLDNQTGISIMKIVEKLDSGPVMHQDKIQINEKINTFDLSKILSKIAASSIINSLNKIERGDAKFKEQDHRQATYAKKISKSEGKINWNQSARTVLAKINGLNPNPGAWFEYKKDRFKVWKAEIVNKNSNAGKIIDDKLTIACDEQSIKILEIQKEGKSRQSIDKFLLGNKIKKGEIIN